MFQPLDSKPSRFCLETHLKKSVSFINTEGTKTSLHQSRKNQKYFEDKNTKFSQLCCFLGCLNLTVFANIAKRCQLLKACISHWPFWSFVCYVLWIAFGFTVCLNNLNSSHSGQSFTWSCETKVKETPPLRETDKVRTLSQDGEDTNSTLN